MKVLFEKKRKNTRRASARFRACAPLDSAPSNKSLYFLPSVKFRFSRDSTLTTNADLHPFCFDCLFIEKDNNIVDKKIQKHKDLLEKTVKNFFHEHLRLQKKHHPQLRYVLVTLLFFPTRLGPGQMETIWNMRRTLISHNNRIRNLLKKLFYKKKFCRIIMKFFFLTMKWIHWFF